MTNSRLMLIVPALIALSHAPGGQAQADDTNNILVTGYWPPTNEMIRHFSADPEQNPGGWQGGDWEGRGYDVYAFFPEFDDQNWPIGEGDLEVDYQDTSEDFWRIVEDVKPAAIVTFSRGFRYDWELEINQRNLPVWMDDYRSPFQPTPAPPDGGVPDGYVRYSSLPVDAIAAAITNANIGLIPFIDHGGDGGGFLSEFIAYHGVWYHDLHMDPGDPLMNAAAGHIHVAPSVTVEQGVLATEVTLRTLIDYLDSVVEPRTVVFVDGVCPGPMTLRVKNATPGGVVAFLAAHNKGSVTIPSGRPCAGVRLDLDRTVSLAATARADAEGNASITREAPLAGCGLFIQALDISACLTTNVESL